jgi:dTMP kinase
MNGGIIVIEGIDGAGKSTVSQVIADNLARTGIAVDIWSKSTADYGNSFAMNQLGILKKALWDYPKDARISDLGDMHWLCLLGAWFSAIDEVIVKPAIQAKKWIILDGWYFKFAARYRLKPAFASSTVDQLFQGLTKPNLVAFLHVDPQVAGVRKGASITPTECGVHDAPHLVSLDRFISYQTQIQDALASEFENIESITVDGTYDDPVAISTRATHSLSEWLSTRARLDG